MIDVAQKGIEHLRMCGYRRIFIFGEVAESPSLIIFLLLHDTECFIPDIWTSQGEISRMHQILSYNDLLCCCVVFFLASMTLHCFLPSYNRIKAQEY